MPITVIVRSATRTDARLTFDGTQPVVIGRGSSCDVRLPDASVSHRHAQLRAQGADFLLIDEGSTNGTFVGSVPIAPRTSRLVRSGDLVRLGRVWLELRIDRSPVTRDVAVSTRDLALSLVAQALEAMNEDLTAKVRVVGGRDQGAVLPLLEDGRAYVLGRGAHCDLPLGDEDVSREHARVVRRGGAVLVRDLGARNGTWLGEKRAPEDRDAVWRPAQAMRIGRTVLALEEPVNDALAQIERGADEAMGPEEVVEAPASSSTRKSGPAGAADVAAAVLGVDRSTQRPGATSPELDAPQARKKGAYWSPADMAVIATALGVIALSIAGLVWLLHG